MNRYSILVKTTIFFILIFVTINALLFFYNFSLQDKGVSLQAKRYINAMNVLRDNRDILSERTLQLLKPYDLQLIKDKEFRAKVFINAKTLFKDRIISIYSYNNDRYLAIEKPPFFHKENKFRPNREKPKVLLFKDNSIEVHLLKKQRFYVFSFTILLDILLLIFYIFLYKKIKPLNTLKDNISKFAQGNLDIRTNIKGKDEIADVANEFDYAIGRIKELTQSRNLFLRNIMHEFKTPITKGKLISDTLENSRKKEILQKAFYRLEYLLGEFGKIEELTSGKVKLKRYDFMIEELIAQAMDILLLDEDKIDLDLKEEVINVDFELFSIALKNLIDNSIKYNTNGKPKVIVTNKKLIIKNKASKLNKDISEYLKPFNREYESHAKGLGLGLYITNSIVKIHGFKMDYYYEDEYHYFIIEF